MRVVDMVLRWQWGLRVAKCLKRSENRNGDVRLEHDLVAIFSRDPTAETDDLILMALVKIGYCLLSADVTAFMPWLAGDLDHDHTRLLLFTECTPVHGVARIVLVPDGKFHLTTWALEGSTLDDIAEYVSSPSAVTERYAWHVDVTFHCQRRRQSPSPEYRDQWYAASETNGVPVVSGYQVPIFRANPTLHLHAGTTHPPLGFANFLDYAPDAHFAACHTGEGTVLFVLPPVPVFLPV